MKTEFRPGIDALLSRHGACLRGKRVGLVSHAAAVDSAGRVSAGRLAAARGVRLAALFGPEHGFDGLAGAGVPCRGGRHPLWRLRVHSLYGRSRAPRPAALRAIDTLLVDLQDLGVRCYTYVATLRRVMEAAAAAGKQVVVLDRPVPLPNVVDGPMPRPAHMSFVAAVPAPLCYGMTPGETALWLRATLELDLDLRVIAMQGYARQPGWDAGWPPWIPPSPAIVSWESARAYPALVFAEGLVSLDCGRGTPLPFRVFGAPWMRGTETAESLRGLRLPGVAFEPHLYCPAGRSAPLAGVRLSVTDPDRFRPVRTAVAIVGVLQALYGRDRVWRVPPERAAFFDKLMGTPEVRQALLDGEDARTIAARWRFAQSAFRRARGRCMLY
ncbi:MAG: DUF1343 domain-containing protein [Lentisphaerae bacterium]|nr:DUF1343 domain-containing protein [Lentisphaerota bacterium]